jgi:hypothetical protein
VVKISTVKLLVNRNRWIKNMEGLLHALTDKKHSVKYWIKEQTNSCGNGELPLNVGCQNVGSQIQGDENEVA